MIVTPRDLIPAGWVCEHCHEPFEVGDSAYGVLTGVLADGTVIEGDYQCADCWRNAGTRIYTDAYRPYCRLATEYDHEIVDHAVEYARGQVHTNGIENFWCQEGKNLLGNSA